VYAPAVPRTPASLPASLAALALLGCPALAFGLDKQGSGAHGGEVASDEGPDGFDVEGALSVGVSLYNPSYGARPDNSGRTLLRYAAHADVDLVGRKLSVPLDVNVFTDRLRSGASVLAPTELDLMGGLTSTWPLGPGALELSSRFEHDRPVDRAGFTQTYADARVRYLYSLAKALPALGPGLRDGDVSGWLTVGWFALNPSYAARPDNTGLALLRYAVHAELSVWHDRFSVGLDGTMFTDRHTHALRPSELDLTPELIYHLPPYEVHLAYEADMPLDRSGLMQSFVYLLGVWSFDLKHAADKPFEDRGQVLSP
jgi:hypothetical protein